MSTKTIKKVVKSITKANAFNKTRPAPRRSVAAQTIAGPLVVLEHISDRQVLTMIRDAINIALAEPIPTLPPLPFNMNSWHDPYQSVNEAVKTVTKSAHRPAPARPVATTKPQPATTTRSPKFYRPAAAESAPEQKTWRSRVNEWIANFVGPNQGVSEAEYGEYFRKAYKDAYRQLVLRHRVDVEQRARNFAWQCENAGKPVPLGNEPLDFIERLGLMEEFFRIVCEMYPINSFDVDPAMRSEPVLAGTVGAA